MSELDFSTPLFTQTNFYLKEEESNLNYVGLYIIQLAKSIQTFQSCGILLRSDDDFG